MIPPLPLNHIAPLLLGNDLLLVCNGRAVVMKSAPREEVRARGFVG